MELKEGKNFPLDEFSFEQRHQSIKPQGALNF